MYQDKPDWRKCKIALESIRQGKLIKEACQDANISMVTFWRWRNKSPILTQIYNEHISAQVPLLEEKLIQMALGGNSQLLMFALKNLSPERYTEEEKKLEQKQSTVTVQIVHQNGPDIQSNERRIDPGNSIECEARAMLGQQS